MFKIGDFSKLSQVSIVTLRHYDEIGLLKPSYVDDFTGFRYYSQAQMPRLNRIVALKDLGFSLAQIATLLEEDVPTVQLEGMLQLRRAEVQQLIEAEQARLDRIEARLSLIQQEKEMSDSNVTLKEDPARLIASLRRTLHNPSAENEAVIPDLVKHLQAHSPATAEGETVAGMFQHLRQHLKEHGHTASQVLLLAHDRDFREDTADVEAVAILNEPVVESDQVRVSELPATLLACAPHTGSLASFLAAYQSLSKWIEQNGYAISGPTRDTTVDLESGSKARFEVQIPVEKEADKPGK